MTVKKAIYIGLGCLCLGLGCLGIALPVLPTVPFFLATVFFFSRSSERLHNWFIGTKMYKNHLESFVNKEGMTVKTKLSIMATVTLVMAVSFVLMKNVPIGQLCLGIVWVVHVIVFVFFIKTAKP